MMDYELVTAALVGAAETASQDSGWLGIPTPWLALIGTLGGGIGIKVIEPWVNKRSRHDSTPAEIREELRLQIQSLKEDVVKSQAHIDSTEKEMNEWQAKYWELIAEHSKQQRLMLDYLSEVTSLKAKIKEREN